MKDVSDRALNHLTPASRCSAIFAALSRGDATEAERLTDTAPRAHYAGADFTIPFERALAVATTAALRIERAHKKYCAAVAVIAIAVYRQQEGDHDLILETERHRGRHQETVQATWAAYTRSVQDVRLDPAEVMRAVWPFDEATQELLRDAHEPDAEALALYRTMLGKDVYCYAGEPR